MFDKGDFRRSILHNINGVLWSFQHKKLLFFWEMRLISPTKGDTIGT
jgi:hypothetical protein